MDTFSVGEQLLLGALALLAIFWMGPGIKASLMLSKNAKADWPGFLWPMAFVLLVVLLLIGMVR